MTWRPVLLTRRKVSGLRFRNRPRDWAHASRWFIRASVHLEWMPIGTFENKEMKFFIGPLNADHKMQGLLMIPWNAALEKRVKDNVADFDREPPLRRYAEALASGQADVAEMTPELGAATKSQWPQIQKMIEGLGGLKSLVFQNVDSMGWDVYMATFEKGKLTLLIGPLNADHKMEGLMMRP